VTDVAETLLEQALMLPAVDRAQLASGLLASLDGDDVDEAQVERVWSMEAERRAAEIASGEVTPVSWEQVLSRIDERRA
jgi:putative addiction module component (TIGR02574 family)